jgi:hypothetical protein
MIYVKTIDLNSSRWQVLWTQFRLMRISGLNLTDMRNEKCRYQNKCHYYSEDAFTCKKDKEARAYCGVFPIQARVKSTENNGYLLR